METFLELLKIFIPALLVMLTAWLVIRNMLHDDQERRRQDLLLQTVKTVTPVRLQAYERVVLFLERISPVQAVFRVMEPDMSPARLQAALVQAIREEFEHNIAQQIYISPEAWVLVRNAREETVRLINASFISINEKSTANDLAKTILENWSAMEKNPVQSAVDYLKNEVRQLFGEA